MQDTKLACEEVRRCIEDLGLTGIEIGSHINEMPLSDPSLYPIFETCADLNCPIFVVCIIILTLNAAPMGYARSKTNGKVLVTMACW
jgi:predicted TIM-barrel fold metal-dependent hydrolase